MSAVLELRNQAQAETADAFVERRGPVALLARPPPEALARATLTLQGATTLASHHKPNTLDELLVMLRAFRTLDVFFFKPSQSVQVFQLGRGEGCAARVDDPSVSKVHASLIADGEDWRLRDERSLNGTFVNIEPVRTEKALANADLVTLGDVQLVFIHTRTLHSQLRAIPIKK